jgi:hypothetical protein
MNMPAEIIKEFRVSVPGLEHSVKGRIVKSVKGDFDHVFLGEFSHYCKPHEDAFDVYSPDIVRQDYHSAEHLVLSYLENFTTINVKPNKYY